MITIYDLRQRLIRYVMLPDKRHWRTDVPRFYLHLNQCGTFTADEEGRELVDMSTALSTARLEARAIMAAEVLGGKLCLSCDIEVVHGETGERITVPFRDALTVTGI